MLVKGEKIKLVKAMGMFDNIGEVCEVVDVTDTGIISFKFGNGMHLGCMSADEFPKYFEKYVEEPKKQYKINNHHVENILDRSEVSVIKAFDKCTIVACKLPNGFVIVESSSCIDPKNYNSKIGIENCMKRIKNKIYELEGYKMQDEYYCEEHCDCEDCCDCIFDEDN